MSHDLMAYVLPLRDQFMTEDHGCGVCSFILLISLEGKKHTGTI